MSNDDAAKIIVKSFCFIIFLLAFGFLSQAGVARASAPTYFGSASNPADNGTGADGSVLAVTPPASMNAGDLVVLVGQLQASPPSGAMAISATGGQSWSSASTVDTNDQAFAVFWTQFNGTWSADPSISFPSESGTQPATAVMHVFRPASVGSGNWVSDTALAGGAEASASPVVISGITPNKRDNVTLAGWAIPNVSTWGTLSGTGWVAMDIAQWRNTSGSDQSATFAHQLQSTPAATNDVSQVPSTATAGISFTMAWSFQFSPTVALNTPADASSDSDTTPTLNFTGTDTNADTLEYNVQVDTQSDFHSGSTTTYYIDGSDASATDPDSVWTNDANAFDSDDPTTPTTFASTSTTGSTASNYLMAEGTDAPSTGGPITQVRARMYSSVIASNSTTGHIFTDGLVEDLGNFVYSGSGAGWTSYTTLSTPTGGWTWTKVQSLEFKGYRSLGSSSTLIYRVDIEVTSDDNPLLSKFSSIPDAGFTAGHPFASGTAIDYTVQAGDALAAGTYYWRAKGIDPSGSNTYGAWSATRSFTVTAGSPARVIRLTGKVKFTGKVKVY